MLDGQGCLLPVRHFLPEDPHFWPAQHSASSADAKSVSNADLTCISSQADCKSTIASTSLKGTKMNAVHARSNAANSSKGTCENESTDITQVACNGVTNKMESLARTEKACFSNVNDAESSDCKEKAAGVDCSRKLQNGTTCLDEGELLNEEAVLPRNCKTQKQLDESCGSEAGSAEAMPVVERLPKTLVSQADWLEFHSESCRSRSKKIICVEKCQDPSAGNVAEKQLGCASNADCSSEQQPYLPGLDDELALRCLAFVPLSCLSQLSSICKKHRSLVKSREIFQVRRTYDTVENLVFVYTSGPAGWTTYDANANVWKSLPPANVSPSFEGSDKESLSAGTHVLWFGKDMFDCVYYRYDLLTNSWEKGPSMVSPRCLFASASCGDVAYVAGGFGAIDDRGSLRLLNSAEMYNSLTGDWEQLPPMSIPRQKCAGVFMDGKFYVIGGKDINHQPITSAEEYDPITRVWRTIPNMYFTPSIVPRGTFEPSPPLVAVVSNQLYAVENATNTLKIYNKHDNTWTNLGYLPVSAHLRNGWGVAFKALGDRLFVMGDLDGIAACCWRPGPVVTEPCWQLLSHRERGYDSFLFNCAVMTC